MEGLKKELLLLAPSDCEIGVMYVELLSGRWPRQLKAPKMVTPHSNGKAVATVNHMTISGAIAVFQLLGWDELGKELMAEREAQGKDPYSGKTL